MFPLEGLLDFNRIPRWSNETIQPVEQKYPCKVLKAFNFPSFEIGVPVWSCCYDSLDINIVYAGCSNGSIYGYDLRKISDPICKCAVEENSSFPIHSLAFDSQNNGLLIGSLRGAYFKKDITDSLSSKPAALALPESLKGGNKGIPPRRFQIHCSFMYVSCIRWRGGLR